eukprot:2244892-Pleurochrysis_carterae.AAC.1
MCIGTAIRLYGKLVSHLQSGADMPCPVRIMDSRFAVIDEQHPFLRSTLVQSIRVGVSHAH